MKVPLSTTSSLSQSQQPYRSNSDPRLGSVWVVRLALSPYIKISGLKDKDVNKSSNGLYEQGAMADFFGSGDILLMYCNGLDRYVPVQYLLSIYLIESSKFLSDQLLFIFLFSLGIKSNTFFLWSINDNFANMKFCSLFIDFFYIIFFIAFLFIIISFFNLIKF